MNLNIELGKHLMTFEVRGQPIQNCILIILAPLQIIR